MNKKKIEKLIHNNVSLQKLPSQDIPKTAACKAAWYNKIIKKREFEIKKEDQKYL